MNLLIDIGNSEVKWVFLKEINSPLRVYGLFQSISILSAKQNFHYFLKLTFSRFLKNQNLTSFDGKNLIKTCKLTWSSVVSEEIEKKFYKDICNFLNSASPGKIKVNLNTPFVFKWGKVKMKINRDKPKNLGLDRWAAMIGLASLNHERKNIVVVSVGTATVYDFLSWEKKKNTNWCLTLKHGLILPGFKTMNESLISINPRLTSEKGKLKLKCGNTNDSVLTGISLSQISPLFNYKNNNLVLLHGGMYQKWQNSVTNFIFDDLDIIYDPWLIFRGLYWISKN